MSEYRLYSDIDTKETYFESWGASTKHPDSIYRFSDYENKASIDETFEFNCYQWLAYIASNCLWSFHSVNLMKWVISLF